jgi:hypothetical protein
MFMSIVRVVMVSRAGAVRAVLGLKGCLERVRSET